MTPDEFAMKREAQRAKRMDTLRDRIRFPEARRGPEARMEDIAELFFLSNPECDSVRRQVWVGKGQRCDLICHVSLPGERGFWQIVELKAQRAGLNAAIQLGRYIQAWRHLIDDTAWIGGTLLAPSYDRRLVKAVNDGPLKDKLWLFDGSWMASFQRDVVAGVYDEPIGPIQ